MNRVPRRRYNGGDPTLNQRLRKSRRLQRLLLAVDIPVLFLVELDLADLERISLPAWWLMVVLVLHVIATVGFCRYLSNKLKYLCLYKASDAVWSLKNSERERRCNSKTFFACYFGIFASVFLFMFDIIPHICSINHRPRYYFFAFILLKTTMLVDLVQLILLWIAHIDIERAIAEWQYLVQYFPSLSFSRYAEYYDGDEESIIDDPE